MAKKRLSHRAKIFSYLIIGYIVLLVLSFFSMSFCSLDILQYGEACDTLIPNIVTLWVVLIVLSLIVLLALLIKKRKN